MEEERQVTSRDGSRDPRCARNASRLEAAALEELIQLEEDVGDELLCSATVERDEFAAKQAVRQYAKTEDVYSTPPLARGGGAQPREGVKPPEFAEEVLSNEVRERPGRDDHHKDELIGWSARMLDEHFFLIMTGHGMCCEGKQASTCASIWGLREV